MTTTNNNDRQQKKAEKEHTKRTFKVFDEQILDSKAQLRRNLNLYKALFDRIGARNGSPLRSAQERVKRETIEGMLALDLEHLKPGDQIYIPSDYHRSDPTWNILGGLATVTEIENDLIRVKEDPIGRYLVKTLRDQAVMKRVFGNQRARVWTEEDSQEVKDQQPVLPEDHPRRTWAERKFAAICEKLGINKKKKHRSSISIHTLSSAGRKKDDDQTTKNQAL